MIVARVARSLVGPALCAWALCSHAEPAVTVRAVDLRQRPSADSESVVKLPAEAQVDLVTRSGAWVQLKAGPNTGWAKVFDVRMGAADAPPAKGATGPGIADTLNLASGSRASSVSTGVRGLDADMLERAQPNFQQVTVLAGFAASPKQAREFAHTGKLTARQVELLPPPQVQAVQVPSR